MLNLARYFCLTALLLLICSACRSVPPTPAAARPDAYEQWVTNNARYPRTLDMYRDEELMKQAKPTSPIYICLSQQRGRLYVNGKVAADWPVSSGTDEHPTPTGTFQVLEKKSDHISRTWGKILDSSGRCVIADADARTDTIPEGGQFIGSIMPYWQRLTPCGIGMHTGKVRVGRQLSHGCVRTPSLIAKELFRITAPGQSAVTISEEKEPCYPTFSQPLTTSTSAP